MPRFPTARASRHVEALAAKHRVTLAWMRRGQPPESAQSYPSLRIAICPRPSNGFRYLIALHELGHCIDPLARRYEDAEDPRGTAVCEGAAWAWASGARDRSIPVTVLEWSKAGALLAGYWAFEAPVPAPPGARCQGTVPRALPGCPQPRPEAPLAGIQEPLVPRCRTVIPEA